MSEIIVYQYHGNSCAPFRARRVDCRARSPYAALVRNARRTFGAQARVATHPVRTVCDLEGRNIYGPAGREVIQGGNHYQVWDRGTIVGYVSYYPGEV